jgi:hypothetical protein
MSVDITSRVGLQKPTENIVILIAQLSFPALIDTDVLVLIP